MSAGTSPGMSPDHDTYADWDGAYVLGALPPHERDAFERHLAVCGECRRAVAELLPMPGLLARVEQPDSEALLSDAVPAAPPAGLEERLVRAARAESAAGATPWWRRTRTRVGLGLAAAAAVAAAVVVPLATREEPPPPPSASLTLRQTVPSPLSATVALTRTDWGTKVDMTCFYAGRKGSEPSRDYGLFVIDADGRAHEVSSWWAGPGEEARTTGSIDLGVDDLRSVEVRAADGVTVLLSAKV